MEYGILKNFSNVSLLVNKAFVIFAGLINNQSTKPTKNVF